MGEIAARRTDKSARRNQCKRTFLSARNPGQGSYGQRIPIGTGAPGRDVSRAKKNFRRTAVIGSSCGQLFVASN